VDGHGDLVRDPNSKAILNINRSEIELARERKRLRKIKQQEEQNLKEAVTVLQNEISDIKLLLSQLVEKL
jgi:hypothetical protein